MGSNFSMKHIPFPTYDLQPAMKTSPERVDAIIRRMQENLQRNSNPRSFGSKNQNFRLTQGFLLSSTQQVLDKWCAQVQDTVQTINKDCNEPTIETQQAAGFIKDAEKCKLLLSSLHETTARRDETCPITTKLQQISTDLESFLTDHIATSVNNMLATTQELCPNVIQHNSKSLQDLQVLSDTKSRIPKDFVKNLVNDTIGVEIYNKVNEMNLILANHISDKVIDDVIDNLARTYKGLVGDLGSMKKKRSLTPDVLKGSSQRLDSQSESDAFSQAGDNYSQKSSPSPISTPHLSKRKSVHDRKLRPKSVVDGSEDYAPDLLAHMQRTELDKSIEEQDSVPELPEIPQLQHLAKNRPKRPKKHASTKNVLKLAEGGDSEDIKEGLDTFFAKSLTPNQTPIGSPLFEELHGSRHGSLSSASSPSIASRSREDLRMKVAQDKLKSKTNDKTPPGTSPFTARRSETEVFTSKRRSFFTGDQNIQIEEKSPDDGETGSDDVVKRAKTGVGLGGDILAEMRVKQEKRASVIPKTSDIGSLDNRADTKEEENPFGGIKLRSTGRASNLTSPTTDFSPENPKSFQADVKSSETGPENAPEKIKHSSSSIIGLRAANFDASKSKNDISEVEESRPRPPPKPRPWSIVGVDRKSGEYTQVDGGTVTPPSPTENSPDSEEKLEKSERRNSVANRGSVRDMIACQPCWHFL